MDASACMSVSMGSEGYWVVVGTCKTEFMKQRFPELTRPGTFERRGVNDDVGHPRAFSLSLREMGSPLSSTRFESPKMSFGDVEVVVV